MIWDTDLYFYVTTGMPFAYEKLPTITKQHNTQPVEMLLACCELLLESAAMVLFRAK